MSRLATLAVQRETLLERSAHCRLQLDRDVHAVREAVRWPHVATALAPTTVRGALGVALAVVWISRAARFAAVAGRILLVVRLVRLAAGYLRSR